MNYLNELTAPRTELEELKDWYCDYHKDVYGVKARWIYDMDLTMEQLEAMYESLREQGKRNREIEEVQEAAADAAFLKAIEDMVAMGAGDQKTALRWLHDAHDTGGDNAYLGFDFGCSYQFVEKFFKNLVD